MKCIDCLEYAELGDGYSICLIKSSIKKLIIIKDSEKEISCNDFISLDSIKNDTDNKPIQF